MRIHPFYDGNGRIARDHGHGARPLRAKHPTLLQYVSANPLRARHQPRPAIKTFMNAMYSSGLRAIMPQIQNGA
jgi:hypothetical protein